MADDDEKGDKPGAAKPAPEQPVAAEEDRPPRRAARACRRCPRSGLFGYAWSKQNGYEQMQKRGRRGRAPGAAQGPEGDQRRPARRRRAGPGADRRDAAHPGPALPGRVRHLDGVQPEARRQHAEEVQARRAAGTKTTGRCSTRRRSSTRSSIATPDFWHAEHAIDCLKAGQHVYCEKEMSNTLEGARSMVLAARETGKLLQIGHQRRSNPRYQPRLRQAARRGEAARPHHRRSTASGTARSSPDLGWPERYAMPDARLEAVRLQRRWTSSATGAGTRASAAARSSTSARTRSTSTTGSSAPTPRRVIASGGLDYYDPKTHEWYDTVMAIYEYDDAGRQAARLLPDADDQRQPGLLRELHGRPGHAGHLRVRGATTRASLYRDPNAPGVGRVGAEGLASSGPEAAGDEAEAGGRGARRARIRVARPAPRAGRADATRTTSRTCRTSSTRFAARRKLNCPAEVGYETAVDGAEGQRGDRGEAAARRSSRRTSIV